MAESPAGAGGFETPVLCDAIILLAKGNPLAGIRPAGSGMLFFEFAITEQQASAILRSRDADLCRAFHSAWRSVRKRMDVVRAVSGGGR